MRNARRCAPVLAVLIVLAASCAKQTNTSTPPVPVPQTALQWTIVYNAALAKANRAVEQAAESVQKSGAITVAQARPIILMNGRIATASEAIRAITSSGTEATWNIDGPKIQAIVKAISPSLAASTGNAVVDTALSSLTAAITLLQAVQQ